MTHAFRTSRHLPEWLAPLEAYGQITSFKRTRDSFEVKLEVENDALVTVTVPNNHEHYNRLASALENIAQSLRAHEPETRQQKLPNT